MFIYRISEKKYIFSKLGQPITKVFSSDPILLVICPLASIIEDQVK